MNWIRIVSCQLVRVLFISKVMLSGRYHTFTSKFESKAFAEAGRPIVPVHRLARCVLLRFQNLFRFNTLPDFAEASTNAGLNRRRDMRRAVVPAT
jgi:hypothetical protein